MFVGARHGAVIFIRPSGSKGDRQPDGRVSQSKLNQRIKAALNYPTGTA
jgi:hypothetical protein